MATIEFRFQENDNINETTDVKLCAERWNMVGALSEIEMFLRSLINYKTGQDVCLYHKAYEKDDWGKEHVSEFSTKGKEGEAYTEFVPLEYIIARLSEALEPVKHLT